MCSAIRSVLHGGVLWSGVNSLFCYLHFLSKFLAYSQCHQFMTNCKGQKRDSLAACASEVSVVGMPGKRGASPSTVLPRLSVTSIIRTQVRTWSLLKNMVFSLESRTLRLVRVHVFVCHTYIFNVGTQWYVIVYSVK